MNYCFQNREGGRQDKHPLHFSEPSFPVSKGETVKVTTTKGEMRIQGVTGPSAGLGPGSQPLMTQVPSLCPSPPPPPSLALCPAPTLSSPVLPSVILKVRPHHRIISNYL